MTRKTMVWSTMAVVIVGGVFGLYWFQPWKLVTNTEVADAIPSVAPDGHGATTPSHGISPTPTPPGNRLLASGDLISHEHHTTGQVQVIALPDGRRQLVLRRLDTSNGPDLRVWLTDQRVVEGTTGWRVFDDGRYVEVGRLKGNRGDQVYELPASVDLDTLRSITIWCKRFSVSFGAATLT